MTEKLPTLSSLDLSSDVIAKIKDVCKIRYNVHQNKWKETKCGQSTEDGKKISVSSLYLGKMREIAAFAEI